MRIGRLWMRWYDWSLWSAQHTDNLICFNAWRLAVTWRRR